VEVGLISETQCHEGHNNCSFELENIVFVHVYDNLIISIQLNTKNINCCYV